MAPREPWRALREQPAVVVTDLEMPTMDGFPLLRLLKADPASSHIPVLILTSHNEAASRYWSLRTGADAYLTKDHDPQELVATVAAWWRSPPRRTASSVLPRPRSATRSGRSRYWPASPAIWTPRCSRRR